MFKPFPFCRAFGRVDKDSVGWKRRRVSGLIASILSGLCLVISQSVWAGYYNYDGRNLSYHSEGLPIGKVDYWAVYYFHKGVPTTNPTSRWGMDISKSADGVTQSVVQSQKFEKAYEKWCGCSWGLNTYFNPLYPVAVINGADSAPFHHDGRPSDFYIIVAIRHFHEIADKVSEILSRINEASDLANQRRIVPEWKGALADFFRAMHKSLDQFQSLRAEFGGMGDIALRNLEDTLNSLQSDVDQQSRSANAIIAMLNVTSNDNSARKNGEECREECAHKWCHDPQLGFDCNTVNTNAPYLACSNRCP
jgi:hypothetical protein